MRGAGFQVEARDVSDAVLMETARTAGVPPDLGSCHTAQVDGYVVEGHVPAADIRRMLRERPAIVGIAVAGMPAGSPGMEQGGRTQPYDVIAFRRDGTRQVWARH